ncbi:ankyrin repeat protein [Pandoravirus inopinatum]|uniref:Ankyrin repeat protein n=1 Tax=Pandoravirus inopinatum TaxID=1605721 RepID=A0A0B5J1Q2_9VIRU|nr:ankyrin repeat protein [Pandoravirus inopinatum]AJF97459.1 ankyrin repeat protein [Pandoravirus inopinatum]
MQTLPTEIVDLVLDFVGPLPHARVVCRQWRDLIVAQERRQPGRRLSAAAYMGLLGECNAQTAIEWARSSGCHWHAAACAGAAKGGHLGLLMWLRRNGCSWNVLTYGWALTKGHQEIVAWLDDTECPKGTTDLWKPAILGSHDEILDWLLCMGGEPCPRGSCRFAARIGRLDLLQRIKSYGVGCLFTGCCAKVAGKKGHMHILEWLCDHGQNDLGDTIHGAACGGKLDIIQWAVARGHAPSVTTMGYAAGGGHRHVIEWLRDRGAAWYGATTGYAAHYGHFDLLKWLYAQGCPLSTKTFLIAARGAPLPILEWLRDQHCPLHMDECLRNARTPETKRFLASCAHLDVGPVQW